MHTQQLQAGFETTQPKEPKRRIIVRVRSCSIESALSSYGSAALQGLESGTDCRVKRPVLWPATPGQAGGWHGQQNAQTAS